MRRLREAADAADRFAEGVDEVGRLLTRILRSSARAVRGCVTVMKILATMARVFIAAVFLLTSKVGDLIRYLRASRRRRRRCPVTRQIRRWRLRVAARRAHNSERLSKDQEKAQRAPPSPPPRSRHGDPLEPLFCDASNDCTPDSLSSSSTRDSVSSSSTRDSTGSSTGSCGV